MDIFLKIGLLLLFSIPLARIFQAFKLPKVLGYLFGGILFGPFILNLLDEHLLKTLLPFQNFALAYLLFLVGTKLKVEHLKGSIRIVLWAFLFQFSFTFLLVTLFVLPLFKDLKVSLFIGLLGVIIAPASTIAIIDEFDAEGPVTSSLLLLLVINDLVILYLFKLFFPFVFGKSTGLGFFYHFYITTLRFFASILIGVAGGFALTYIEAKSKNPIHSLVLALGIVFTVVGFTDYFKLNSYAAAFFTGFIASNSSIKQTSLLKELQFLDTLIYILFFFISGANMHLNLLVPMLPAVFLYVIARGTGQFFGAYKGALKAGAEKWEARSLGMGILTQAGLALGFALLIGHEGGKAGIKAMNLILSSTIVFEILGIILLKKGLFEAGEIRLARLIESAEKPILDLHFDRILKEFLKNWGVKLKTKTQEKLVASELAVKKFISLSPESSFQEIIEAFEKAKCHTIPVISEENDILGIINLKDIESFVLTKNLEKLILAQDIMRLEFKCLPKDASLEEIQMSFRESDLDALPVCEGKKLLGMVLRKDILRFI